MPENFQVSMAKSSRVEKFIFQYAEIAGLFRNLHLHCICDSVHWQRVPTYMHPSFGFNLGGNLLSKAKMLENIQSADNFFNGYKSVHQKVSDIYMHPSFGFNLGG